MTLMTSLSQTALVTGASSGIGRELARGLARRGHTVILVAPVESELQALAREFRAESDANVHVFAVDLRSPGAADEIASHLARAGLSVDILVNNAGLGYRGNFWEIPPEDDLEMIRVNVEAPVALTKRLLPFMLARGHGRILNTASIAGFEPGPLLAVYHATKAFVLSWSEALATELQGQHVTVTALCPGPVDTDFFPKAHMEQTRAFQQGNVMGPHEVAEAGLEALLRGERLVVPGAVNKVSVFSRRLLPESAQARKNAALYEEVPADQVKRSRGDVERAEQSPAPPPVL